MLIGLELMDTLSFSDELFGLKVVCNMLASTVFGLNPNRLKYRAQ